MRYFTKLTDLAKHYNVDESLLFKAYCKMTGNSDPENMSRLWQQTNGEVLLAPCEVEKIINIMMYN
ncbi:MAG TPA: hypothetical protein PKI35_06835 [Bacteroidales bacterium]|nr:hypothetical protein [Bacteroidales bacterium]